MAIEFEIIDHIAVLEEGTEYRIELNIVSWNGDKPKLEIRKWKCLESGRRAGAGIRLTDTGAARLRDFLVKTDLPPPGAGYVQLARATAAAEAADKVCNEKGRADGN